MCNYNKKGNRFWLGGEIKKHDGGNSISSKPGFKVIILFLARDIIW